MFCCSCSHLTTVELFQGVCGRRALKCCSDATLCGHGSLWCTEKSVSSEMRHKLASWWSFWHFQAPLSWTYSRDPQKSQQVPEEGLPSMHEVSSLSRLVLILGPCETLEKWREQSLYKAPPSILPSQNMEVSEMF